MGIGLQQFRATLSGRHWSSEGEAAQVVAPELAGPAATEGDVDATIEGSCRSLRTGHLVAAAEPAENYQAEIRASAIDDNSTGLQGNRRSSPPDSIDAAFASETDEISLTFDTAPTLVGETPIPNFSASGRKWGPSGDIGTSGAVITWSIAGAGWGNGMGTQFFTDVTVDPAIEFSGIDYVGLLRQAFAAWSQFGNIEFIQVVDAGHNFGIGAVGDIRIGAAAIDGLNNTLAQARLPDFGGNDAQPPSAGEIVFDTAENWTSAKFFLVALHEIGHSLGLNHQDLPTVAIMNPQLNLSLTELQADDIAGIQFTYGTQLPAEQEPSTYYIAPTLDNITLLDTSTTRNLQFYDNGLNNIIDTAEGMVSTETFHGRGGNDTIYAGDGGDTVFGGIGNDVLEGEGGTDLIHGQDNDDTLNGGADGDTVYGDAGLDLIYGGPGNDGLYGGSENDRLFGNAGADTLAGEGGDDELRGDDIDAGGNQNDVLVGGIGADMLYGGFGSDILVGESGADFMDGGDGEDTIQFGTSPFGVFVDLTTGTGGTVGGGIFARSDAHGDTFANIEHVTGAEQYGDSITGNAQNNIFDGYAGNDGLYGLAGRDTLIGGDGNDTLDGGTGADYMAGGVGNDLFYFDDLGDTIAENAGEGTEDRILTPFAYSIALQPNIEILSLLGTGDAWATGNAADNIIHGNEGANILDGGTGADRMFGAAGADTYLVDHVGDVVDDVSWDGAIDTVQSSVSYSLVPPTSTASIENLLLLGTADINGTGNDLANSLIGNSGNNRLNGATGNDALSGRDGGDTIISSTADGNDTLTGGSGFDVLDYSAVGGVVQVNQFAGTVTGSAGNDTLVDIFEQVIGTAFGDVLAGGNGINVLDGNGGADQLFGNGGQDLLRGGDGGDTFFMQTADGNDTIEGGAGFDLITFASAGGVIQLNMFTNATTGTAGNDTFSQIEYVIGSNFGDIIAGNNGVNAFEGGGGADQLFGNGGVDWMRGGTGNDTVILGTSNDTYYFRNGDGVDTINDFAAGGTDDNIDLTTAATGYASFAAMQAFAGAIVQSGADTFLNLDPGGGSTDRIILKNVTATNLTAADFAF